MQFKLFFFIGIMAGLLSFTQAQITVTPVFPTVDDTVTVVFDATQGNAALVGTTPVYMHTGVITNLSTSPTDWKHVQLLPWPTNDPKLLMAVLGNNKHQAKFHIRSFYGIGTNEVVLKLAFVFRNAAGTVVGKDASGNDIYYDVYSGASLQAQVIAPQNGEIYQVNDMVALSASSSSAGDLSLYVDNVQVQTATNATSISYNYQAITAGQHWVKLIANSGGNQIVDSVYFLAQGTPVVQSPPAGTDFGITYLSATSVRLALSTPYPDKDYVYVIGDFNGFLPHPDYAMKKTSDGKTWWLDINNLTPGQEYAFQYYVKSSNGTVVKIGDPYADKVLDPWNDGFIPASVYPNLKPYPNGLTTGIVSVLQTNQPAFNWQVPNFTRPKQTDLVVYELLLRDFSKRHSFQALMDTLWYLKEQGVNAVQLMPIMEFDGNESWGYSPAFMFAVDKYYGTKDAFKTLVDYCHQNGMAVILDIVLNHQTGNSPLAKLYWDAANNKTSSVNPWFNVDAKHPFNVFHDMNHDAPESRAYFDRVLKHWLVEYKVDGFRFDLSKGFTQNNTGSNVGAWGQYDASRIYNINRLVDEAWTHAPTAYMILEHFADNSEEKELANHGSMLWGNLNSAYNQITMGYNTNANVDWMSWKNRGWNSAKVVGYMESHDEERLMYKNLQYGNAAGSYNVKSLNTALDRMGMAAALFYMIPGPKMIWQFGEVGYDISIDVPCKTCNKPILWNYFAVAKRNELYQRFSALAKLKVNEPAFESTDFTMNTGGQVKQILVNHFTMNVVAVGNMNVSNETANVNFQNTGKWYDFFSGDSITVSSTPMSMTFAPGEYHVYTTKKLPKPDLTLNTTDIESPYAADMHAIAVPNPFTEEVEVGFALDKPATVSVKIYNMWGQEVAVLCNNQQLTADIHTYTWTATDVPAGIYIYRVYADGKVASGKVHKQ